MNLDNFDRYIVDSNTIFKNFICDDDDLKDFLFSKSKDYSKEKLAVTYVFENNNEIIAYFSIFNDSLNVEKEKEASKSAFKKLISSLAPHGKRHLRSFPAIKLGRLSVSDTFQRKGIGKQIISIIIGLAVKQNDFCACKFITVDAYKKSLEFYEGLEFEYLSAADKEKDTRQMYLDLTPILNAAE